MEEYLKKVSEQIRCEKARPYIEQELRDHLEDQISANTAGGMDPELAIDEAVKDMGDPIEAGIMLDHIHRPQIAWELIALTGIISLAGLLIHLLLLPQAESRPGRYLGFLCLGIVVMAVLYWIDYTVIARFSRPIAGVMLGLAVLTLLVGTPVNGQMTYLVIGGTGISMKALMLLYVPVYGGILYQYYGKGYGGIAAAIFWMVLPVLLLFRMSAAVQAVLMLVILLLMLTAALGMGWFPAAGRMTVFLLWGSFAVLPAAVFLAGYTGRMFLPYQMERLRAFVGEGGGADTLASLLREVFLQSEMIGNSGIDLAGRVESPDGDYLLAYLTSAYGLLMGAAVCGLLAGLIFLVFRISKRQKNQLGRLMGAGCAMLLGSSLAVNLLVNAGMVPPTATFLPFLSSGGANLLVSYALVGVTLSIYKYKNIYPRHVYTDLFKKREA